MSAIRLVPARLRRRQDSRTRTRGEDEENAVPDVAWLGAQLTLSLEQWDKERSQRNAKETKQLVGKLDSSQLKYQKETHGYQLRQKMLGNAALELQTTDQELRLAQTAQQEKGNKNNGQAQQADARTDDLAGDLELHRYDNAEARLDNAWDRLHNERRQTANVVYQFRQKGDHGMHKRPKKLQEFALAHGKLEARHVELQITMKKLQTKVQIEEGENTGSTEGHTFETDELKESEAGCQHDQHAPPARLLDSVLTSEEAIQGRAKLERCVNSLEAREAQEAVERERLLQKLQDYFDEPKVKTQSSETSRSKGWKTHFLELPLLVLLMAALGVVLATPAMPAIGVAESEEVASNPALVIPVYCLLVIPIGLYLTHDVIDMRWRSVRSLRTLSRLYGCISFLGLALLTAYACIQFLAGDVGEGMAAVVSCSVAIYGGYLRLRQRAILQFFTETVQRAARRIRVYGVVREGFDLEKVRLPASTLSECVDCLTEEHMDKFFPGGPCYDKISSVFLDDNFPGEGPRVTWLAFHPKVEDKLEFLARIGLWVLMASRPRGYSFSGQLQPKPESELYRPVEPTSSKALWTIDMARLLFCAASKKSGDDLAQEYSPSDVGDLVERAAKGGVDGCVEWVETLRRVPVSEWAEALAEYPSGDIIGLSEDTISWEVLLALCSLQMKTTRGDESTLRARAAAIINHFEDFGNVDGDESASSDPETECLSPREDDLLPLLEALTKQWPVLLALLESSRAAGVIRMQFDEQIKRSQDVDLLVMVALMLGVVPQWELEFDCEPFLPMKNTTLLFQKREEYVVQIVRKYHDRGETE